MAFRAALPQNSRENMITETSSKASNARGPIASRTEVMDSSITATMFCRHHENGYCTVPQSRH